MRLTNGLHSGLPNGDGMTSYEQKQIISDLAESKGLQGSGVRLGRAGYGFFIKSGGRVLHDAIFDYDEAVCFLSNYDVGSSRREDTANDGR